MFIARSSPPHALLRSAMFSGEQRGVHHHIALLQSAMFIARSSPPHALLRSAMFIARRSLPHALLRSAMFFGEQRAINIRAANGANSKACGLFDSPESKPIELPTPRGNYL